MAGRVLGGGGPWFTWGHIETLATRACVTYPLAILPIIIIEKSSSSSNNNTCNNNNNKNNK